jgi:hypothetical protein
MSIDSVGLKKMPLSDEDVMLLQSQLEGLESVFLELIPFGVELKRQQIQEYYDKRFADATTSAPSIAEKELRRQFNTRANNVRTLIDNAESLGSASSRFNLIRAAATLPSERSYAIGDDISNFSNTVLTKHAVDMDALNSVLKRDGIRAVEARILLGCLMFLVVEELTFDGKLVGVRELLDKIFEKVKGPYMLEAVDPFAAEAQCVLEAMKENVS